VKRRDFCVSAVVRLGEEMNSLLNNFSVSFLPKMLKVFQVRQSFWDSVNGIS